MVTKWDQDGNFDLWVCVCNKTVDYKQINLLKVLLNRQIDEGTLKMFDQISVAAYKF